MEFIRKNWQKMVMILLTMMFLSTCVSNCSHKNELRVLKSTYAQSDSIISDLQDTVAAYKSTVKDLNRDIKELKSNNQMLKESNADLNKALNRKVVVNITQVEDEKK